MHLSSSWPKNTCGAWKNRQISSPTRQPTTAMSDQIFKSLITRVHKNSAKRWKKTFFSFSEVNKISIFDGSSEGKSFYSYSNVQTRQIPKFPRSFQLSFLLSSSPHAGKFQDKINSHEKSHCKISKTQNIFGKNQKKKQSRAKHALSHQMRHNE